MSYHEGSNWQAKKEDQGKPLYENKAASQPPAVRGAEDIDPTSQNMTTGMLWAKYVDVKDADGKNALSLEGFQKAVRELRPSAVWVKASERLPKEAGQITWRWLDKEAAYSGFNGTAFVYDKGGAQVDMLYAIEIEWLDESPAAAGDGKEAIDFEFTEWAQMSFYNFQRGLGWSHSCFPGHYYTTAQLYDIFKIDKNK
jgi:hypothetical protein